MGGTIAFQKKVTMKTVHTSTGRKESMLNLTPTRNFSLEKSGKVVSL
jgi:hypothetical protein